jgi:carboxymethylenebutenolidase
MPTDLKTKNLDIQMQGGTCDAFVAYPDDHQAHPGVLFLMDAYGLRPYLRQMAEKLASHGYYVLVPNLFYRVRRSPVLDLHFPLKTEDMPVAHQKLMSLFQTYDTEKHGDPDMSTFVDFLSSQPQVRKGKIGVTGYCMGGRLGLRAAALCPDRVGAVASFHAGNIATDEPSSTHRLVDRIQGDIYVAHADHDRSMPPEQIERFQRALDQTKVKHRAEVYKDAAHGFTMADLPAYNEAALKKHWDELLKLFKRSL